MNDTQASGAYPRRRSRWKIWVFSLLGVAAIGLAIVFSVGHHYAVQAEPLLRKRIIETVSARFNSPVELDSVHITTLNGLQVSADGLRVLYLAGPQHPDADHPGTPMLTVKHFSFTTDLHSLLRGNTRVGIVHVDGLELHIPPPDQRRLLLHGPNPQPNAQRPSSPSLGAKISLHVSHVLCDNAKIFIETTKPGKDPLEFDVQHVEVTDMNWSRPFHYDALLTNPKPVGTIHAVGAFGPWNGDDPRQTPIDGDYNFSNADLNTIHGIGGILSSSGHFAGQLGGVVVDGVTNTPDFSIDTAKHPVPLHTEFHAIVDGTTGDTTLDPVRAHLLHSDFTARGTVTEIHGKGHDIALDVDMTRARIEDMLALAVKTKPPLMQGALAMHTRLHIPPGRERVAEKLELAGSFDIRQVSFSNASVQDKIDAMSMRAQGKPKEAAAAGSDHRAEVASEMKANFTLGHAMTTVHDLQYQIPGALVLLNGVYSLNGEVFEFKGHVRTEATASQMTTGWKSFVLKAVDPFLKKNGAGLELPISISGTQGDPHFGLAMHGSADESTEQMKQDLKNVPAETAKKDSRSERKQEKKQKKQEKKDSAAETPQT